MTISESKKHWTDDELLALPRDGHKREIVGGELVVMSPASFDHGALINRLVTALGNVVFAANLGELGDGQTGYRLSTGDLFSPDISFVSKARIDARRENPKQSAFFQGAPDFFVEVLSPSDSFQMLREKLEQFFREGTRLAWIIDPRKKCVYVHRSADLGATMKGQEVLEGEDVIPGFRLPVSRLFP